MRTSCPSPRAVLTAVATCVVLVPAAAGLAASSAQESSPVEVAALVQSGGRLVVQHATASSEGRAESLAQAWDARPGVVAADVVQPVRALEVDPRLGEQWGMTALRATEAWRTGPASSQVVAVLDTGVDAAHPDLAGVVLPGKDLVGSGDARTDPHGHGTHVAGIVAEVGGNGIGGAGLAQGARVLPVRVLDASGWGSDSAVAQGLLWAVEQGATVVNLSLAGESPSTVLTGAIQHALDKGVVVVAGSGNSGEKGDPVLYPAATPGVIAVGAVNRDRARPAWSSTGSHLSLVAPGASILSTVPGGRYEPWSGTSMASPFVAAAAALLKQAEPGLTPAQVRTRLVSTARDLGPAGHDPQHGAGMVDVVAALAVGRPAPAQPAPTTSAPTTSAPVTTAPARKPVVTVRGSRSAGVVKKGAAVTFSARALADGRGSSGLVVQLERKVPGGAGMVDVVAALAVGRPAPTQPAPANSAPGTSAPTTSAPVTTAPARKPVVTVRGSRSAGVVKKGAAVTFSARALADGRGSSGVVVQLERKVAGGAWTVVRRGTSGSAGLLSFRLVQDRTAEYRFRSGTAASSGLRVAVLGR